MKNIKEQSEELHFPLTGSSKEPNMKYFKKYTETESIEIQRIKNYCLKQLKFNKNQQCEDLAGLLTAQKSRLKGLRKVTISVSHSQIENRISRAALGICKNLRRLPCLEFNSNNNKSFYEVLRPFWTQIGNHLQKLKSLSIKLDDFFVVKKQGVTLISKMIKKHLKSLEYFKMNIPEIVPSSVPEFRTFAIHIGKGLKKLQGLDLTFCRSGSVSDRKIEVLVSCIQERFRAIKRLKLIFADVCGVVTDSGVKTLALEVGSYAKNLEYFGLDFQRRHQISDAGLKAISVLVGKHLKSLKQFDLTLSSSPSITGNGFTLVVKSLKGFQKLNLSVRPEKGLADSRMQQLAKQLGENCRRLRHLILDLSDSNISNQGFQALSDQIGNKLKDLAFLEIDLSGFQHVTEKGVKTLATQVRKNLGLLQHLSLVFAYGESHEKRNWTGEGLMEIAKMIEATNIKGLRYLQLKYKDEGGNLFNKAVNQLATSIAKNLSELETLDLFVVSSAMGDDTLKEFTTQITEGLNKIQHLSLAFPFSQKITNEGFETFIKIVAAKCGKMFKSLDLSFRECKNINSDGFSYCLTELEKNIKGVRSLKLDFSYCLKISLPGIRLLDTEIGRNLKRNRFVNLILRNQSRFRQETEEREIHEILYRFNQN